MQRVQAEPAAVRRAATFCRGSSSLSPLDCRLRLARRRSPPSPARGSRKPHRESAPTACARPPSLPLPLQEVLTPLLRCGAHSSAIAAPPLGNPAHARGSAARSGGICRAGFWRTGTPAHGHACRPRPREQAREGEAEDEGQQRARPAAQEEEEGHGEEGAGPGVGPAEQGDADPPADGRQGRELRPDGAECTGTLALFRVQHDVPDPVLLALHGDGGGAGGVPAPAPLPHALRLLRRV